MKQLLLLMFVLTIFGCGYSSKNSEMIGQVKKVTNETPLICPDYSSVDLSMGVMRNGVGSMSTQDIWLYIQNEDQKNKLDTAARNGKAVRVNYDIKRVTFCVPDHWVTSVEVLD